MSSPVVEPRDARPEDARDFAQLVALSDSVFLPFMFGERFAPLLLRLFPARRNLFSHEHVRIVEADGHVAGMLLGYSYDQMRSEMVATTLQFLRSAGFYLLRRARRLLRGMPRHAREGNSARWLTEDEFYISNLAVKPEFRRQGLGRRLLADAAGRARDLGCRRIALDVETDNRVALRLYEREGFVKEASTLKVLGRFEFFRLSKPLANG